MPTRHRPLSRRGPRVRTMLEALLARRELHPLPPFARQLYASPSVCTTVE